MTRLLLVLALVAATVVVVRLLRAGARRDRRRDPLSFPPLPEELRRGEALWVVFTTGYCATCGPVKERIGRLDPTAEILEVDVAQHPDLADRYRVRTAPTVLFTSANGMVHARFVGNVPEAELATVRR